MSFSNGTVGGSPRDDKASPPLVWAISASRAAAGVTPESERTLVHAPETAGRVGRSSGALASIDSSRGTSGAGTPERSEAISGLVTYAAIASQRDPSYG